MGGEIDRDSPKVAIESMDHGCDGCPHLIDGLYRSADPIRGQAAEFYASRFASSLPQIAAAQVIVGFWPAIVHRSGAQWRNGARCRFNRVRE